MPREHGRKLFNSFVWFVCLFCMDYSNQIERKMIARVNIEVAHVSLFISFVYVLCLFIERCLLLSLTWRACSSFSRRKKMVIAWQITWNHYLRSIHRSACHIKNGESLLCHKLHIFGCRHFRIVTPSTCSSHMKEYTLIWWQKNLVLVKSARACQLFDESECQEFVLNEKAHSISWFDVRISKLAKFIRKSCQELDSRADVQPSKCNG